MIHGILKGRMKTKKATRQDLAAILNIMSSGSTADHTILIKNAVNAGKCWVASIADKQTRVGILDNTFFYGQNFIDLLIVHPEYRRRGIASALIRKMEQICLTNKLFASTNESNATAQKTYETNGFVRSWYIENLDEGDPEIIYLKRLATRNNGGER
jgi:ribosomal protein S18 acetylase RimI-like enzyme